MSIAAVPRRGVRQRLIAAATRNEVLVDESPRKKATTATEFATKRFIKGSMSAVDVEELASTEACSHLAPKSVERTGNNHARDVLRKLKKRAKHKPEVYACPVRLWDCKAQVPIEEDMHFLLPYEFVESDEGTAEEWAALDSDSPMHATREEWATRMGVDTCGLVATGIWGDTAPFWTRDSLMLLLWSPLGGPVSAKTGLPRRQRHWICAVAKRMMCDCGCKGRHTMESIWAVLSWIYQVWMSGRHPAVRSDGIRFSDSRRPGDAARAALARAKRKLKTRGCCVQHRADWSWSKVTLNLTGWRDGPEGRCCWKCNASLDGEHGAKDASEHAPWRTTMVKHLVWIQVQLENGV